MLCVFCWVYGRSVCCVCSIGSMVDLCGCAVCCVFYWVYGRSVWMRCMLCVLLGLW